MKCCNVSPGFIDIGGIDRPCSIKATINPKILTGENDYLAAATADYLNGVESLFNAEAKKISPILGEYSNYSINRPDYCANFDLKELGIPCTSQQMIYLIKHGDIPRHYSERTKYDNVSKRKKSDKDSFYLESNSVTINYYRKQAQLEKKFPNCKDIDNSRDLIRLEVQCNYLKAYSLSKSIREKQDVSNSDVIREMLSDDFCADIVKDYFERVIRRGDYFTLNGAIKEVQRRHLKPRKEERLINELKRVNQYRGIAKVKETLSGDDLNTFRRTLRDLADININPVTIPREWNIPRIPNLLYAYKRKIEDIFAKKLLEEMNGEVFEEYLPSKKKKRK